MDIAGLFALNSVALIGLAVAVANFFKVNPFGQLRGKTYTYIGLAVFALMGGWAWLAGSFGGSTATMMGTSGSGFQVGYTAMASAIAYNGTSFTNTVYNDNLLRASGTDANSASTDTLDYNITLMRKAGVAGNQNIEVKVVPQTWIDEATSGDATLYSFVDVTGTSQKVQCYIASNAPATSASAQESSTVVIAESASSVIVGVHCNIDDKFSKLNTLSSRYIYTYFDGQLGPLVELVKTG